jgi:LysM repeat protein
MRWALALLVVALLSTGCSSAYHAAAPSTTTATVAPTSTTTTVPVTIYRVKSGDVLIRIAEHFGVSLHAIMTANHLSDPDRLTLGQKLRIPPPPPRTLTVKPAKGRAGDGFELTLTGAQPGEVVRFEIDSPKGKFTGGGHTASGDGTVTATYQTGFDNPAGRYTVIVHSKGPSTAPAHFRVLPSTLDEQ